MDHKEAQLASHKLACAAQAVHIESWQAKTITIEHDIKTINAAMTACDAEVRFSFAPVI